MKSYRVKTEITLTVDIVVNDYDEDDAAAQVLAMMPEERLSQGKIIYEDIEVILVEEFKPLRAKK